MLLILQVTPVTPEATNVTQVWFCKWFYSNIHWLEEKTICFIATRLRKGGETIQIQNEQGSDQEHEFITWSSSSD